MRRLNRRIPSEQTIEAAAVASTIPRSRLLLIAGAAITILLAVLLAASHWANRESGDVQLARDFAAALDLGNVGAIRQLLVPEPDAVMWPSSWSRVEGDLIGGDPARLASFVEFHTALDAKTSLENCQTQSGAIEGLFAVGWLACDYVYTDSLLLALKGVTPFIRGMIGFDIAHGAIEATSVTTNQSDQVADFARFIFVCDPDTYDALMGHRSSKFTDPENPVAYSSETARTLLALAARYRSI